MSVRKIIRNTVLTVVGLIAVLVVALGLVLLLGLNLNLNALRGPVSDAASNALGRSVTIDGDVRMEASLWPLLSLDSVQIANAEGFDGAELASLDEFRVEVEVLPLLSRRIHVRRLIAEGVNLNLESNDEGVGNWEFDVADNRAAESDTGRERANGAPRDTGTGPHFTFEVDEFSFDAFTAQYTDHALDKRFQFNLERFGGRIGMETPLALSIKGGFHDQGFAFEVSGPPLQEVRDAVGESPFDISEEVAGTSVALAANYSREGGEPRLDFGVGLGATDVGAIVAWLGVAERVNLTTGKFAVDAGVRGNSLREIAERSDFTATLTGGQWTANLAGGESGTQIVVQRGAIKAAPGEPLSFNLDGVMNRAAVNVQIVGAPISAYLSPGQALPVSLDMTFYDVEMRLDGSLVVPFSDGPFEMNLSVKGNNLTTFNDNLGLSLPTLGPYRVEGCYAADGDGFKLDDMLVVVGESELNGAFRFDRTKNHQEWRSSSPPRNFRSTISISRDGQRKARPRRRSHQR